MNEAIKYYCSKCWQRNIDLRAGTYVRAIYFTKGKCRGMNFFCEDCAEELGHMKLLGQTGYVERLKKLGTKRESERHTIKAPCLKCQAHKIDFDWGDHVAVRVVVDGKAKDQDLICMECAIEVGLVKHRKQSIEGAI